MARIPPEVVLADDTLLGEAGRQLAEQRAQVDAYASRSGIMIAAIAVLTGLLADTSTTLSSPALWLVGLSAAFGVAVLWAGRIELGVAPSELHRLRTGDVSSSKSALEDALVLAVEANSRAIVRVELLFSLQALATIAGVALLITGLQGVVK